MAGSEGGPDLTFLLRVCAFRAKLRYTLLAFSSLVKMWPTSEEAAGADLSVWQWISSLTASGNTCTRQALKVFESGVERHSQNCLETFFLGGGEGGILNLMARNKCDMLI